MSLRNLSWRKCTLFYIHLSIMNDQAQDFSGIHNIQSREVTSSKHPLYQVYFKLCSYRTLHSRILAFRAYQNITDTFMLIGKHVFLGENLRPKTAALKEKGQILKHCWSTKVLPHAHTASQEFTYTSCTIKKYIKIFEMSVHFFLLFYLFWLLWLQFSLYPIRTSSCLLFVAFTYFLWFTLLTFLPFFS